MHWNAKLYKFDFTRWDLGLCGVFKVEFGCKLTFEFCKSMSSSNKSQAKFLD